MKWKSKEARPWLALVARAVSVGTTSFPVRASYPGYCLGLWLRLRQQPVRPRRSAAVREASAGKGPGGTKGRPGTSGGLAQQELLGVLPCQTEGVHEHPYQAREHMTRWRNVTSTSHHELQLPRGHVLMTFCPGHLTGAPACSDQHETWPNDRSCAKPRPGAYPDWRCCVVAVIACIACIACNVVQCVRDGVRATMQRGLPPRSAAVWARPVPPSLVEVDGDVLTLCYSVGDKGKAGDLTLGEGRQVVVYKRQTAPTPRQNRLRSNAAQTRRSRRDR